MSATCCLFHFTTKKTLLKIDFDINLWYIVDTEQYKFSFQNI